MSILRNSLYGMGNTATELNIPVLEGYDTDVEGHLIDMEETYEDMLALTESLYNIDMLEIGFNQDINYLKESSQEHLIDARTTKYEALTESALKNGWEKIKAMWTKMIAKIKAFFKTIMANIDALTKDNAKFAEKYSHVTGTVDVTAFDYNFSAINKGTKELAGTSKKFMTKIAEGSTMGAFVKSSSVEEIEKIVTRVNETKAELLSGYRAGLCGHSGSLEKGDFGAIVHKTMRSGASVPSKMTITASDALMVLKNTEEVSSIKTALKELPKVFEDELKDILSIEGIEDDKKKAAQSFVKVGTELANQIRGLSMTYLQHAKSAANERANLHKQVIVKLASASSKNKETK